MSDFDPDAYLATKTEDFDPDAYLKEKAPARKTPKQLAAEKEEERQAARKKAMTVESPAEMIVAPALKMVTGAAGKVAGDVVGLGALATKALPGNLGYSGDPQKLKERVERAITHEPEGEVGKAISEYNPIALAGKVYGYGTHSIGDLIRGTAAPNEARGMAGNAIEEFLNQAPNVAGAKLGKASGEALPLKQQILNTQKTENAVIDSTRNAAQDAGYLTPPESGIKASLSGLAGKTKAEKIISEKNAENATKRLGQEVGAAPGEALSTEVLDNLKQKGYDAYEAMTKGAGPKLNITPSFKTAIDGTLAEIKEKIAFDPETYKGLNSAKKLLEGWSKKTDPISTPNTVKAISDLRRIAKEDFAKQDSTMGTARLGLANQLENLIQDNLPAGSPLVDAFRESRVNLAKLHLLDRVVNEATGKVDLAKLAALSETKAYKGVLTGEFETAADFAKAYRKAAQKPTGEAAPRLTVFDGMFAGGTVMAALAGHPGALAVGGAELAGRVGVPVAAERGWMQNKTPSYDVGALSREMPGILPASGVGISQGAQPISALVANAQKPDPQHDAMMARLMWGR